MCYQRALDRPGRECVPPRYRVVRWVRAALRGAPAEVAIRFVDEPEGRALNRDYRGKDYATNVLSFAYESGPGHPDAVHAGAALHGDLVICVPVVVREAREQGKALEAHFAHLVVHGMLHLQGLDHETPDQAQDMEALESVLLADLGFDDPYT